MDKDADIIFGASIDAAMKNEVSITVLATGFDLKESLDKAHPPIRKELPREIEGSSNPLYFDRSKSIPSFRARARDNRPRGFLGYLRGLFL